MITSLALQLLMVALDIVAGPAAAPPLALFNRCAATLPNTLCPWFPCPLAAAAA